MDRPRLSESFSVTFSQFSNPFSIFFRTPSKPSQAVEEYMKLKAAIFRLMLTSAIVLIAGTSFAQLKPNQTAGYGDEKVLTFTYTENFDCIDQPLDDLNYNGVPAQSDPGE